MPQVPSDDRELIRQLGKGNKEAFAECYKRFQSPIFRFVWHMTSDPATAEEVTQEVFVRLIANPKRYDPVKGSLAAYLFGIARHATRQRTQHCRTDISLEEEYLLNAAESGLVSDFDLLSDVDHREQLDCLHKVILALPEPYREVVVLCDLEELSYPDAGALLGCPPGTVASRLHRAHTMLRVRLKELGCVR